MDIAFTIFDRLFFGSILQAPSKDDLDTINLAANDQRDGDANCYREYIYRMMDAIDTKVSGTLTHISLIIAALVFIYTGKMGESDHIFLIILLMAEILAYLVLTIFCLRCISMTTRLSGGSAATESDALAIEFCKMRVAYNWTSNMTVFVTAATIITLFFSAICSR
jgi:hypothetical protein